MRGSIPRRKPAFSTEKLKEIRDARAAAVERKRAALRPPGFTEPIDVSASEVSDDATPNES